VRTQNLNRFLVEQQLAHWDNHARLRHLRVGFGNSASQTPEKLAERAFYLWDQHMK